LPLGGAHHAARLLVGAHPRHPLPRCIEIGGGVLDRRKGEERRRPRGRGRALATSKRRRGAAREEDE